MVIPLLANQDLTPMLVELVVELEVVELFEVVLFLLIVEDGADRETRSYLNNVKVSEVIKVSVLRNCLVMTLIGMLAAKLEVIWKNSIQKQGVCKMYIIIDGLFLLKIQEIEDNTMYSCYFVLQLTMAFKGKGLKSIVDFLLEATLVEEKLMENKINIAA